MKCDQCGGRAVHEPSEQGPVGWDELNCFKLNTYPHELILITDATKEEFEAAVKVFSEGEHNIDTILREAGHVCLCASGIEEEVTL